MPATTTITKTKTPSPVSTNLLNCDPPDCIAVACSFWKRLRRDDLDATFTGGGNEGRGGRGRETERPSAILY